jgi:hypothetical protein
MHQWHPHTPRATNPDAVRRWAKLEAKSATTEDELYRRHAQQALFARSARISRQAGIAIDLIIALLHAAWHMRS